MTAIKTLINFNVPTDILQTFDRLCRLYGKSRSLVLNELLYEHILKIGKQAFSRIDQVRKIDENLKSELLKDVCSVLADPSIDSENGFQSRLERETSSIGRKDSKPSEVC